MKLHAVIAGEIHSVLRLPPSGMKDSTRWSQIDSDTIAHFIQVYQQITKSRWYSSPLSMSGDGTTFRGTHLPSFEDFVFAAVYYRQLTMQKDDLLNAAVDIFCNFTDCDSQCGWIREEQKEFKLRLDSTSVMHPDHTLRELFDAFMYGASLMHKPPKLGSTHRTRFLEIYNGKQRDKLNFDFNLSLRMLLRPIGNAAILMHREFSHWLSDYSLPRPDIRWHARIFASDAERI